MDGRQFVEPHSIFGERYENRVAKNRYRTNNAGATGWCPVITSATTCPRMRGYYAAISSSSMYLRFDWRNDAGVLKSLPYTTQVLNDVYDDGEWIDLRFEAVCDDGVGGSKSLTSTHA